MKLKVSMKCNLIYCDVLFDRFLCLHRQIVLLNEYDKSRRLIVSIRTIGNVGLLGLLNVGGLWFAVCQICLSNGTTEKNVTSP